MIDLDSHLGVSDVPALAGSSDLDSSRALAQLWLRTMTVPFVRLWRHHQAARVAWPNKRYRYFSLHLIPTDWFERLQWWSSLRHRTPSDG
jgi:hypothetical protein